jgi:DNA repair exonuclease SbcCD nuclease subunit
MVRLLHLADVHLGAAFSAFGDGAARRAREVVEAFARLPEIAQEHEVAAVLIAGDLFDGPRPPLEAVAAARETVRRLVDSGRPVFIIPGNHDSIAFRPRVYLEALGGAHVFAAPRLEAPASIDVPGGPLHVYGLAFDPVREPDPLRSLQRQREGVHVVMLHGALGGGPHWRVSPNTLRLTREALDGLAADYVALGDYHGFRAPSALGGTVPACYSGSFAALDFTEVGPRGYVVVDVEPGAAPLVRHCASGAASVVDVGEVSTTALESDAAVADAVAAGAPAGTLPQATLTGAPGFPLDAAAVTAHLRQRFGHASIRDQSTFYASARLSALERGDDIVAHLVRLGRARVAAADGASRRACDEGLRIALRAMQVDG